MHLLLPLRLAASVLLGAASPPIDPAFECYRVNHAWGFALAGSVVDRGGAIFRYRDLDRDRSPAPHIDGAFTYYAAADLLRKFEHAERAGAVTAEVVAEKIALAAIAAAGTVTRADTGTRDAGSSTCHAYLADSGGNRYRDVELGSDGGVADTRTHNDAAEAQALLEWLRTIGVAR